MSELILPLVELLRESYEGYDLSNVKIIGVQHILETTHAMFRSLYKIGLKAENVSLIGKCYSTCEEVFYEMIEDGLDVSLGSFAYSSHIAFDEIFEHEVQKFLLSHLDDLTSGKYEKIIVLDDGGKCISFLSKHLAITSHTVAIEQTSSGYHAIRSLCLPFPVINVARSPLKLELESPMIAQAAADRLYHSLRKKGLSTHRVLVIGAGAIGQAMKNTLSSEMFVSVFDREKNLSDLDSSNLIGNLNEFDLIVGCTGQPTITSHFHSCLRKGTVLVSVSSSDREFDAVSLRKNLPSNQDCHADLLINDIFLVNSGFPVNFDGDRENIAPQMIQLTIGLITAGILEAFALPRDIPASIRSLNFNTEQKIRIEFLQLTQDQQLHLVEKTVFDLSTK